VLINIIVFVSGGAKGPLAELVRWYEQHSSGPRFDSSWERISCWVKNPLVCPTPKHRCKSRSRCDRSHMGCDATVYGWGRGSGFLLTCVKRSLLNIMPGGCYTPRRSCFFVSGGTHQLLGCAHATFLQFLGFHVVHALNNKLVFVT
jgi:hypothetical protein